MSNNSRAAEAADFDTVVKDIAALKHDIGRLMEQAKTDAARTVSTETSRLYGALANEGERSVEAIARQVEERPLASLLVAFAVGFVGGNLLKR